MDADSQEFFERCRMWGTFERRLGVCGAGGGLRLSCPLALAGLGNYRERKPLMLSWDDILAVARLRGAGLPKTGQVLETARAARRAEDYKLVALCLDCFRSVASNSKASEVERVVEFLGELLEDPRFFRMRIRTLRTLGAMEVSWFPIIEQIQGMRGSLRHRTFRRWRREALGIVAWDALSSVETSHQARGLEAYEGLGELGRGNLLLFLHENPDYSGRPAVQSAIDRLTQRIPDQHQGDWWKPTGSG